MPDETLPIFESLGLEPEPIKRGSRQSRNNCPFCDGDKFYINLETTKWDCKNCLLNGNAMEFLRKTYEISEQSGSGNFTQLAKNRTLLDVETLKTWGVAPSVISGDWIIPGYNGKGNVCTLYKYVKIKGKRVLIQTKATQQGILGYNLYDKRCETVYLCEGLWDALALWETLRYTRRTAKGYALAKDFKNSLLAKSSVLAFPGSNFWGLIIEHAKLFAGKRVVLLFDNDLPRMVKQGKNEVMVEGNGIQFFRKSLLTFGELGSKYAPNEIQYIDWGEDGFDPELPSGYDIRDMFSEGETPRERIRIFENLEDRLEIASNDSLYIGVGAEEELERESVLGTEECHEWHKLIKQWGKCLELTENHKNCLAVMLATCVSVPFPNDQLWMRIISIPSSGKTTLCEGLLTDAKHTIRFAEVRGFLSGYKSDKEGKKDHSLLPRLNGKCFITPEGDSILQNVNRAKLFAEARQIYDGTLTTNYLNGITDRAYNNLRCSWLLCGTMAMWTMDDAELGSRFLDFVLLRSMDAKLEGKIGRSAAKSMFESMVSFGGVEENPKEQPPTSSVLAKQLTGGYLKYLRERLESGQYQDVLEKAYTKELEAQCNLYARFVTYIRARPSKKKDEDGVRELSARLTKQLLRLALCLVIVLQKEEVDDEIQDILRKVAIDTCGDLTYRICAYLYLEREGGTHRNMAFFFDKDDDEVRTLLNFLRSIRAVESRKRKVQTERTWRLKEELRYLFKRVVGNTLTSLDQLKVDTD